jgi:DNA ligase 1
MIKRPLKAPNQILEDFELPSLSYPLLGSPKLDGFRCIIDEIPKTSSMKPQPNPFVFKTLSSPEFNGLDGELCVGTPNSEETFNNSTGPLRRLHGKPDFTFYVFDSILELTETYFQRWLLKIPDLSFSSSRIFILPQFLLKTPEEVIAYTTMCIDTGYEGAMVRSPEGRYKQGRATFNEGNIFKRKVWTDAEAEIIGFNEKMTNFNPKVRDEMGLAKRSSHKGNKVGAATLGSFILKSPLWKKPFNCRGKINDFLALNIWQSKEDYLGSVVTFKYIQYGSINAPRQPIFKRFYQPL